jgi:hypothetical protein
VTRFSTSNFMQLIKLKFLNNFGPSSQGAGHTRLDTNTQKKDTTHKKVSRTTRERKAVQRPKTRHADAKSVIWIDGCVEFQSSTSTVVDSTAFRY